MNDIYTGLILGTCIAGLVLVWSILIPLILEYRAEKRSQVNRR